MLVIYLVAVPALIAGLYGLWLLAGNDLLRLVQGTAQVHARVVEHVPGADGFTPIYAFQYGHRSVRVPGPTAYTEPRPALGESTLLSFPKKRPDLARPPHPLARSLLYVAFAAWFAFFSDLLFHWI